METDVAEPGSATLSPPVDIPATKRPIPETTPGWGSNFGEETTQTPSILAPVIKNITQFELLIFTYIFPIWTEMILKS